MTEYSEKVQRVRAGRMAGQTMNEIARGLGVTYGVVSGIVARYNVGLPEAARERIELMRRAKCSIMAREKFTGSPQVPGIMTRPLTPSIDDYVFGIEDKCDAWDEVGGVYLAIDDSY